MPASAGKNVFEHTLYDIAHIQITMDVSNEYLDVLNYLFQDFQDITQQVL